MVGEEEHTVVVIGGGPAGVCAAVSAARCGLDTVLVERQGYLGGMAAFAMFQPWRGFHALGAQLVVGLAEEIVRELQARGGSPGHLIDPTGISLTVTPFDIEILKSLLLEMISKAKVRLLLHSRFVNVEMRGRAIGSVRIRCGEKDVCLKGNVYVDATGDGRLAVASGARYIKHDTSASYRFSMRAVDEKILREFAVRNPHEFTGTSSLNEHNYTSLKGFSSLTKRWLEESPSLARFDSIQVDGTTRSSEVIVAMINLPNVDAGDVDSLARAELRCQQLVPKAARFLKDNCSGFADAQIHATPAGIGFHASVQVYGGETVSDSDVMSGKTYEDSIARCAMPGKPDRIFEIPQRALINPVVENLIVAGRAILPPTALFETNYQPASMQTGEAAGGVAVAMNERVNSLR